MIQTMIINSIIHNRIEDKIYKVEQVVVDYLINNKTDRNHIDSKQQIMNTWKELRI